MDARTSTLTALALAALCASACSSTVDPVAFDLSRPDPGRLEEQLRADTEELGDYKPGEQAGRVIKFFQAANLQTISTDPVDKSALETGLLNMRMAAKRLLIEDGQREATRLGLHMLGGFERELAALAEASHKIDGAAVALLTGAPPPDGIREAYQRFARFGGGFLVLAAANGLVSQGPSGGLVVNQSDRFFIRLAFKVYWANVLPEGTDALDWVLSDFERRWYEIWVVERSKTAPLERKMAALRHLNRHEPDYPARLAQGVALYQARDYKKAVQAFELALKEKPGDKQAEKFLAAAKRKAR